MDGGMRDFFVWVILDLGSPGEEGGLLLLQKQERIPIIFFLFCAFFYQSFLWANISCLRKLFKGVQLVDLQSYWTHTEIVAWSMIIISSSVDLVTYVDVVHKIVFFKFFSIDYSVIFNFIFKVEKNQKSLSPLSSAPIQINFKQVISEIHHESRFTKYS